MVDSIDEPQQNIGDCSGPYNKAEGVSRVGISGLLIKLS